MPVLSNSKHERFAQEIAKGLSVSAAYVAAGYSKNDGNASRLNGNEKVRSRVEEILSEAATEAGITVKWVLDGLVENYNRAMQVAEVKTPQGTGTGEFKYDGAVANKALELIGKHLKMFTEKHELAGPGGGPIKSETIVTTDPIEAAKIYQRMMNGE